MATDFEKWLNAPDDESWDENENPLAGGEAEPAAASRPRAPVGEGGQTQTRRPPQMPDFTEPRAPRTSRGGSASYDDIALASNQFTSRSDVPLMTDEQAKYYGKTKGKMGITETARADYAAATGADAPENPFSAQAANMGLAVGGQLNANIQMDAAQTLIRDGDHLDDDDINAAMDNIMFGVFGPAKGWFAKNGVMEEWDNGIGKGFKDAEKRATARRKFAQQIALDFVKERTAVQRNATTEEEGRGISHGGEFLTRGAGNVAYAMPFALGPAGIALQTAQQSASNAIGLHNDKYGYDDEGNFGIAAKGDGWGKAALKGTASAGFETATEIALGKVGMAALKRGGKLVGADKLLSKAGSMVGSGAGKVLGKETTDAVAQWGARWGKKLGKLYKVTDDKLHIGGLPEEMLEELESAVFNAATGADTRDSEQVDAKGNRTTAWDRTSDAVCNFFKPSELGTMAETMLLTMGAAPFAAKMMNRGNEKALNGMLRRLDLMSEADISETDYNTKVAALDAWRNSLTDEQVIDRLKSGQGFLDKLCDKIEGKDGTAEDAKAVNDLKRGIMERIAANAGINLDELGKTYQPFQVRLRTKPDGTDVPDFKTVIRVGSDGSRGGKARTVEDADGSGISIEETATGYRVNLAPGAERDGMDFGTFEEAVDFATKMKPKVILDREIDAKKREWIRAEFDENYKGANVYSAQDIDDALRFCKNEYGVDMAKNAHFDRSRKAWILDNGTVVLVRSNINSPTELKSIMRHELVGHGGMNGATFLDATFRNQDKVLARARAKEAALQKKRAAGEEVKPEDELTDAEHMALTKANADAAGYSEEEGRKEAVALNVEQTRHGADAIDKLVAMGRNALRSIGVNLETNQTDIDVAAAKREKELRKGDTGASGLLNNEDKDYRANVGSYSYERPAAVPKTAPAELTDEDRAARANAEQASQAARIEQGHPFLWQYAMEQSNGDVQGAIDFAQNVIGKDAQNGNHAEENYINEQIAKRENEADRQKRQAEAEAKARGELEAETQERWEKNLQERTAQERVKHEGAKLRRANERAKREAEGLEGPERDNLELQRRIDRMKQNHPAVWEFALRQARAAGQHGAAAMDYAEQIVRADAQNKNGKGERAAAAMVAADKAKNRENLTAEEAKILVKHGLNLPSIGYVQGSGQKYVEDTRTGKGRWVWDGGLVYDIEHDTTPDGPKAAAERAAKEREVKAKEELEARQLAQREREDTERMRKAGLNRQRSIPDWRETNASQFAAEAEQERLHREREAAEEEARRKAEEERIADFAAKFNGGADITQAEIDALPEAERANFAKEMREAGYNFFKKSGTWHKAAPKLRGGKVASASTQTTETKENTNEGGSEEGPVQGPVQAGPQGGQGGGQGQGNPVREGQPVRKGQEVKDENKSVEGNAVDGGAVVKEPSAPAAASTKEVWEDDGTGTKRPHRRVLPQTEEEKRALYEKSKTHFDSMARIVGHNANKIADTAGSEVLVDSDMPNKNIIDRMQEERDSFESYAYYDGLLDFAPDGKQTLREKLAVMDEQIATAKKNIAAMRKRLADEAKEVEPQKRGRGRPKKLTAEEIAAREAQMSEAEKNARDLNDRKFQKEMARARRIRAWNDPNVSDWMQSDARRSIFQDFLEAQANGNKDAMRDALARLKSADEEHDAAPALDALYAHCQSLIDNPQTEDVFSGINKAFQVGNEKEKTPADEEEEKKPAAPKLQPGTPAKGETETKETAKPAPAPAAPQKPLTPEEARQRAELKQKTAAALGATVFGKSVAELQQSRKQEEYRLHNLNRQLDAAPDQQTHARLMPQIRNTEQRIKYWDVALEEAGRREGVDPNAPAAAPAQTDNKLRRAMRAANAELAEDRATDDGFNFYSPELTTRESEEANGEADFYSDELSSRSAKEKAQNKYLTNFADRFHPVKTAVRDILMDGGMTRDEANRAAEADEASPYHQKRVQSGKAEADLVRVRSFGNDLEEDIKRLAKQNLTVDDIGVYAYALHAPARNRQKLIESKGKVVDGSGISTALAQDILNGRPFRLDGNPKSPLRAYTTAQLAELKQAHDRIVHRLNDNFGLNYLYDAGLIDQQSVDTLTATYGRDWVSLADDVDEDGVEYGRLPGATVMNPLKRAHGRHTALKDNPVITTFLGAERNILAAKKNMAAESLARFVEAHPEMGTVSEIYPNESINDSCVTFRRNVDDPNPWGERNARMVIRLKGERGREIARSFNEADVQRGPGWLQSLSRIWASFATQLSPTFSVRNFLKDTNEVTLDITGTLGTKAAADFVKGQAAINPLMNKDFRDMMRTWRETGEIVGNSPMVDEFRRFVKAGGLIGGGGSREGYGEMHDRLANETMLKKIAAQFKAQNAVKPVHALGEAWNAYVDLIGGINENIEMLSRFNNFRTRIANGQSDAEAAINSREGSTDFGMYGNQRWMNSVWMFSNSILGGTLRAAKTLTVGKYGRRLAAGMFALGMVEGFADALMNGGDDDREKTGDPTHRDIKEYDWQNSLHIRFGGTLVRIPIHAGPYSLLKYAGNNTARWMMGKISGGQAIENTANQLVTILTHFTGTGEHGVGKDTPSLVASLTPSAIAQPLVQIGMNEDYKGDRIHRVNTVGAAKNSPAYKLAKSDTNAVWVEMSRLLNNLPFGGGTDYVKGRWDVAPESMQYLFKQIVKNLGSDVVNTGLTAKNVFDTVTTGENHIENNDIPFWRDVVRRAPDARGRYYEALEEHEREAYAYKNAPAKEKREYLREHPNAARTDLKPVEKRIKELSALSRGDVLDNRGSVVRHIEISAKRKEAIDKETKRLMAVYLKRLGKNGDNKLRRGR